MEERPFHISEPLLSEYSKKRLSPPAPVKLFMGLILSQGIDLTEVKQELADRFGQIDIESPIHPFEHTGYYTKEMGPNLRRCFLGFIRHVFPDHLAEIKLTSNRIEIQMGTLIGERIFRLVNLDPGIITLSNVILATTKNRAHRIYLTQGIYAEVTLIYSKDLGWQPLDWTYPDYRAPVAMEFFKAVRESYYLQIRDHLRRPNPHAISGRHEG